MNKREMPVLSSSSSSSPINNMTLSKIVGPTITDPRVSTIKDGINGDGPLLDLILLEEAVGVRDRREENVLISLKKGQGVINVIVGNLD